MVARSKLIVRLRGLSMEETIEFNMLDALSALDEHGKPAWIFEGCPITEGEKRWLSLYLKQVQPKK